MEHRMTTTDYVRIEKAIRYLQREFRSQPDLAEVAAAVGVSEYHFQRLFRRWAGISPKRFVQYLTATHARALLRDSHSVLDAALRSGLSGPGRLHDLMVNVEAMTPGEVGRGGEGLRIAFGFHAGPFGECLIAATERGVCGMQFVGEADRAGALAELGDRWPHARLEEDASLTAAIHRRVFPAAAGEAERTPVTLLVRGTNFQIRVWEALLRIPVGAAVSYGQLAAAVGAPGAARAVGSAVARNPIAYLIPCHRVIRGSGEVGEYRWGSARKAAMLGWEASRAEARPTFPAGARRVAG
jgi:AraC family transcriptional regulator, regulatory protein of adaptative response / methylated-DNA-[protein]-cysteine methyltransferase